MARTFDEKLEGAGYEEAGASETVGAGCTIDEDANSSDVSSPSNWGSQCLKIIEVAGQNNYVYWDIGSKAIAHLRFEIVPTAEGLADNQYVAIAFVESSAAGECFIILLEQISGQVYFNCYSYYDGNGHDFYSLSPINLDTRYRIEVKWDATNDKWAWKIDGVNQPNNVDSSAPITSEGTLSGTHETDCRYMNLGAGLQIDRAFTAYYDLIAIDDADWVGEESTNFNIQNGIYNYRGEKNISKFYIHLD